MHLHSWLSWGDPVYSRRIQTRAMRFPVVFDAMLIEFLVSLGTQEHAPVKLLPGPFTIKEPLAVLAKIEPLDSTPNRRDDLFQRSCAGLRLCSNRRPALCAQGALFASHSRETHPPRGRG